jgi:two-component system phosphate regulon sensor histidine kinase PhoR
MALSLLGIIFVQSYWILNSYNNKESQFITNVRQILVNSANEIELKELEKYYDRYSELLSTAENPENITISEIIYKIDSDSSNDEFIFSDGILEEDYKVSTSFLDTEIDSIIFKKITSKTKKKENFKYY